MTVVILGFGLALWFLPIENWRWVAIFGSDAITYVDFLLKAQPFSTIVLVVIATALFMTRKVY